MGTESMASIIAYLRSLAPRFFAARMRGASGADILQLEQAASLRMTDGHRELLRTMGNTPARVLNPFLNDRDFCIDTLVAEYGSLRREGISLPPGVAYFSSSEITGSNIFLRHGADPSDDPEIGDIHPKTGELILITERTLESYVRWHAFRHRMNQLDYELLVRPVWNAAEERWEGDHAKYHELLAAQGFAPVFHISDGTKCLEHDGIAVALCPDGSMGMAGDDLDELKRRAQLLAAQTRLVIEPVPSRSRLRAPRE
jgi:hypothetical protein